MNTFTLIILISLVLLVGYALWRMLRSPKHTSRKSYSNQDYNRNHNVETYVPDAVDRAYQSSVKRNSHGEVNQYRTPSPIQSHKPKYNEGNYSSSVGDDYGIGYTAGGLSSLSSPGYEPPTPDSSSSFSGFGGGHSGGGGASDSWGGSDSSSSSSDSSSSDSSSSGSDD